MEYINFDAFVPSISAIDFFEIIETIFFHFGNIFEWKFFYDNRTISQRDLKKLLSYSLNMN
jgi:hypothetical protein